MVRLALARWLVGATIALGGVSLVGCATDASLGAAGTTPPQRATAQARVLFRIDLQIDGKRAPLQSLAGNSVRLYLANLDRQEVVRRIDRLEPLPGAAGEEGWASLALEPGTYFFLVVPPGVEQNPPAVAYHAATARFGRLRTYKLEPGRGATYDPAMQVAVFRGAVPDDFAPIAGFLLRVPEKAATVYAGTLRIACTSGRGLFGNLIGECSDTGVTDETAAARSVAHATGADDADLASSLVSRYGRPIAPLDVHGDGLELIAVSPQKDATGIDLSPPAAAPPLVIGGTQPAVAIFNLFSIAGYSASVASAQLEARAQAEKWRPCIERLAREVQSLDLMELVTKAHQSALAPLRTGGTGKPAAPRQSPSGEPLFDYALAVVAHPHQLRLRECVAHGEFCFELAMRVQMSDLGAKRVLFDAELVYANAWPHSDFRQTSYRLYQVPTRALSGCRTLETWCGEGGAELLRKEAAAAVDAIMGAAVQRAAPR